MSHVASRISRSSSCRVSSYDSSGRSRCAIQSSNETRFDLISSSVNSTKTGSSLSISHSSVCLTFKKASCELSAVKYMDTESPLSSFSGVGFRASASASAKVEGNARVTCLAGCQIMTPRLNAGSTGSLLLGHIAPSKSKSQSSQARYSCGFSLELPSLTALVDWLDDGRA